MKMLERVVLTMGAVVVGVTLVYRYALTDEHRSALGEASDAIRSATQEVTDSIAPLRSERTKAEEKAATEANRARTAGQWESLGF